MAQKPQGSVSNVHEQPFGYIHCNDLECENPSQPFQTMELTEDKPMGYEAKRDALPSGLKKMPNGADVAIVGG